MTKMYKTTINHKGAVRPLVCIHYDEAKSLDTALNILKYYDIAVTNIESIETKEII
jgi:hypothetical protein